MGGTNGKTPADVCEMTPEQVAAWYAGPMAAMRQQAERAQAAQATPTAAGGTPAFAEFVRKYSALGVRKTHAEWVEAYRRHHGNG